jgi:hypothetical protein
MEITRIKGAEPSVVAEELQRTLKTKGYDNYSNVKDSHITISDIRLSDDYVQKYGMNKSPYSGRGGRVLGWRNWVEVNNTINEVLDKLGVSANARSLKGIFKIREGKTKFTEDDWEEHAYDNVGSIVSPVYRKDAWLPKDPERARKKLEDVI